MRLTTKLSALAVAAAAMAASLGAQAQSIDVRVIGTITPAACTPTLTGGGVIDYGNIPASTLNMTSVNRLAVKQVPFTITCDAATRVAVRTVDNRAASRVPGVVGVIPGYPDPYNFGLGTVAGANVGGYIMRMRQGTFTTDSVNAFTVASTNNGGTWANVGQGGVTHDATRLLSWAATAGGVPVAFSNLAGTFEVEAVLNRGDALPLNNDVPLDGLATFELVYL